MSIENLTTRAPLAGGLPVLVTARGRVQRSGAFDVFVTSDPWSDGLTFAGRASVRGLAARDLYRWIEPVIDARVRGTIDLYVELEVIEGRLVGGVKPILRDMEVRADDATLVDRLRASLLDAGVELVTDRVPGRQAVATVVPFRGSIRDPAAQLWPAITGVLRNAFVEGIAVGFGGVPPGPRHARRR